jgi:dipeptidyl aminopeptidase/acylaminoacyl peptidase
MKKPLLFLLPVLLLSGMLTASAQGIKTLQLEQSLDMETVSSPQLSPDGKTIIYTRQWIDKGTDNRVSDLWIMDVDGGRNRFFTRGGNAVWSDDGSRVAYTARGETGGTQIFVKYKDVEGSSQVTRLEKSPGNLSWSPDGKQLAFTLLVPKREPWPIKLPGKPSGAKWTEEPRFVSKLVYRRDRVGFLEEGHTHIFVVPADGGTPRQLTTGDWDHGVNGISWTPDGQEILFSSLRIPDADYAYRESEIYAVRLQNGQIRQLSSRKGPDNAPMVSPDGKYVAYTGYDWTDDTFIENKLYVMDISGGNPRELAQGLDRSPQQLIWAKDNSGVYFGAEDRGSRNLYFAPLRGNYRQVTTGAHLLNVQSISGAGLAVGTRTDVHRPADVVSFPVASPVIRQLTSVNDDVLQGLTLGEVEEIWYNSVDNFRIQGWLVKPPAFDPGKKYPLILVIHGGPHAMYNVGFNFSWQHHAAEGYVVLYTNPRGSSGYGSAFGNAIKNDYPNKDYDDLMKGVDEAIQKGYIDTNNLFVYGGSGGGVLTSWIVGHTDRFAAASVNFPVINWLSFVGNTDGASWYRNFARMPWEDPSEHLRRSPLMYVGNVKTPTMLMCGEDDLRTPISQTEEFYQALKVRQVPTVMIRFNEEYHGTGSKPSNFMRTQLYLHHWFKQYARS